jgi:DNA-binding NarL/FixJ family response regulator
MRDQTFRILFLSDDPEDIFLVEEAFDEIEAVRYQRDWPHTFQLVLAAGTDEAASLVTSSRFDAAILDLNLTDPDPLPAYVSLRASAPQLPVVALAGGGDEPLALTLMRHGVDSYLMKPEFDCESLVRSLRCAIERNRLRLSRESVSMADDLTGLFNERGYENLARRFTAVASRHGLSVLSLCVDCLTPDGQDRDIALLAVAEQLRAHFESSGIVARVAPSRLAALAIVPSIAEADAVTKALTRALPPEARLLPGLQPDVCENKAV